MKDSLPDRMHSEKEILSHFCYMGNGELQKSLRVIANPGLRGCKAFPFLHLQMWSFDRIHWSAWQRKWSCGAAGMNWQLRGCLQGIFKQWCPLRGLQVCAETRVWINLHVEYHPEAGHSRAGNNSECLKRRKNHYSLSFVGQEDQDKTIVSRCHFCVQIRQRGGKGA